MVGTILMSVGAASLGGRIAWELGGLVGDLLNDARWAFKQRMWDRYDAVSGVTKEPDIVAPCRDDDGIKPREPGSVWDVDADGVLHVRGGRDAECRLLRIELKSSNAELGEAFEALSAALERCKALSAELERQRARGDGFQDRAAAAEKRAKHYLERCEREGNAYSQLFAENYTPRQERDNALIEVERLGRELATARKERDDDAQRRLNALSYGDRLDAELATLQAAYNRLSTDFQELRETSERVDYAKRERLELEDDE